MRAAEPVKAQVDRMVRPRSIPINQAAIQAAKAIAAQAALPLLATLVQALSALPANPIEAFAGGILGAGGGLLGARIIPKFVNKIAHPNETDTKKTDATPTTESEHPTEAGATAKPELGAVTGAEPAAEDTAKTGSDTASTLGPRAKGLFDSVTKYTLGKDNAVTSHIDKWKASGRFDSVQSFLQENFGYENGQRKNLQGVLDDTNTRIKDLEGKSGDEPSELLTKLQKQQDLLSAGPDARDTLNPKLFTKTGGTVVDELKQNGALGEDATKYLDKHEINLSKAFTSSSEAGHELPAGAGILDRERFSAATKESSLFDRSGQNAAELFTKHPWTFDAAQGALLAGGFLAGSALVNKVTDTHGALRLSTVGVPAAVLLGDSTAAKVVGAGAVVLGSTLVDHILPADKYPGLSHIFAPNGNDAVLMTAGFMTPGSAQLKLAAVGGAYAFDRITAAPGLQAAIGTGALTGAAAFAAKAGKFGLTGGRCSASAGNRRQRLCRPAAFLNMPSLNSKSSLRA